MSAETWDFVIIGSGFGGSVSALRLREKGYSVLVLERGKRYRDEDFATTNWQVTKYIWAPLLRCFGILQISPFRDVVVLHGSGVGGGSLGYANVLMEPDEIAFASEGWRHPISWRDALAPHYATAKRMLGVAENPRMSPADETLQQIATDMGRGATFRRVPVGVFFGDEGRTVPDPFFGGQGPDRTGCTHCGGCMVGCRHGAKNTLVKNYLWLAERAGAVVRAETEVRDVRQLRGGGARYELRVRSSTAPVYAREESSVFARNVIVSAGALGTMRLLMRCRDVTQSLGGLSPTLGDRVRTNSEGILGSVARERDVDYSKGVAITSIFEADDVTTIEPVRYPAGSSLMRFLALPLVSGPTLGARVAALIAAGVRRPLDVLRTHVFPGWANRATVVLVMQSAESSLRMRLGRSWINLWRRDLVSSAGEGTPPPAHIPVGHQVTREFAARTNGIPAGASTETLVDTPFTAHILGGCGFGADANEGVVDEACNVHGYPGLMVVDGSIVPGNPGVNPSLTITAMAEYAMSRVPPRAESGGYLSGACPPSHRPQPMRPNSPAIPPSPSSRLAASRAGSAAVAPSAT